MQDIYGTEKKRTLKKLHKTWLSFYLSLGVGKKNADLWTWT